MDAPRRRAGRDDGAAAQLHGTGNGDLESREEGQRFLFLATASQTEGEAEKTIREPWTVEPCWTRARARRKLGTGAGRRGPARGMMSSGSD